MESFSQKIKNEIVAQLEKSRMCCVFSFLYGAMFLSRLENDSLSLYLANAKNLENLYNIGVKAFSKKREKLSLNRKVFSIKSDEIRYFTIAEIEKNIMKCTKCKDNFLKGLFFAYGTVNDPNKSYRLEFVLDDSLRNEEIKSVLLSYGFSPKIAKRGKKVLYYFTKNEEVEEILARLGTFTAAFSIMNSKINKEMRSNINRMTNCDSANINKALYASQKYIDVINKIVELDMFDSMPDSLKEAASLRIKHKDMNFIELGRLFSPPISKSGVCHRLERIVKYYEEIIENK